MITSALLAMWATCVFPAGGGTATSTMRVEELSAHGGIAAVSTRSMIAVDRRVVNDAAIRRALTTARPRQSAGVAAVSPTGYNAITNRASYPKPPVPALGPAGYWLNDPTFGSRILRVTDGNTRPGLVNRSYRVSSNAHLATWNSTSTVFYVISNDGTVIPYSFNAATMTARRINATNSGNGGLTLAFYVEPHFSLNDPNLIFGVSSGTNNRTIAQYDFSTGSYSTVLDLDTVVGGLAGTYVGGVMTGGTPENMMAFFGGPAQDAHFYLLWAPLGNLPARKLLNSLTSTINGRSTSTTLNFHLHSASMDRSGRYVFLYPTSVDLAPPRSAAQVYLWDTSTDHITALPVSALSGGHDAYGFGYSVNQDCCTSSSWDAMQWQFRSLSNPAVTSDLVSPVLTPKEIYIDDHTSWNNARPDALVPVISSTYRYYGSNNTTPWRAWDDEIIAIDTSNGIGGTVWRFAHHRSNSASDTDPASLYFWYEPIASVSPDGRWVMFTSNWEKTLGRDSSESTYRQDVFIVQLLPSAAASTAPVSPAPTASPTPVPGSTTGSPTETAVPNTTVPAAPLQLTASVVGSTVTLEWQPSAGGASPTSYVVEAGSAPALADLARVETAATRFVASGVAAGVYFVRVRASTGGALGPASNETIVAVTGSSVVTGLGVPTNLTAGVSGRDVTLSWNAASNASSYVLEAGSAPGLRDLAYVETGSTLTTFSAPNVAPGVYYVRIRGSNAAGIGGASNDVVVEVR